MHWDCHTLHCRGPRSKKLNAEPSPSFHGIWPALVTPLHPDLSVDMPKLAAHAQSLLAQGCGGVTLFGTTGEGPSFTLEERKQTLEALIKLGVPADRILVSTSCAALLETLALTRHAALLGTHGSLMLPPFFLKGISEAGVIAAYAQVLDGVADLKPRMYLYHIPQISGVGLTHHVIRTLKDRYPESIVGVKDSGCDTAFSLGLAKAFMPELTIYVGNEPDLPALGRLGSKGAVSGLANFMPQWVHRLVLTPDAPETPAEREQVLALLSVLTRYPLLPAIKSMMHLVSGDPAWLRVRAPLVALTDSEDADLRRQVQALGLANWPR